VAAIGLGNGQIIVILLQPEWIGGHEAPLHFSQHLFGKGVHGRYPNPAARQRATRRPRKTAVPWPLS